MYYYTIQTKDNKTTSLAQKPIINQDGTLILVSSDNQVLSAYSPAYWDYVFQSDKSGNPIKPSTNQ